MTLRQFARRTESVAERERERERGRERGTPGLNCSAAARLIAIPTPSIIASMSPPISDNYT